MAAVSLVKPEAAVLDPEGTEREARVLGRIGSHPNIVSFYEYEIDKDVSVQYMIFQYLNGGILAGYLREQGQQSPDDILRYARQGKARDSSAVLYRLAAIQGSVGKLL